MRVAGNMIANFMGRAWAMLLGIAFVPVYVNLLGIEAYGLIGFFVALLSILGLLDAGLSLALNRELARWASRPEASRPHDLLRTLEIIYWTVSLVAGALIVIVAPWLAEDWLKHGQLRTDEVAGAIRAMGCVLALQIPMSLYQGGLFGLQRQVSANFMLAVAGTFRVAGGALIVWALSGGISTYFIWQMVVAGTATAWFGRALWRSLPPAGTAPRFDRTVLTTIGSFALAVAANAVIGVLLTQLDKVVLSRTLTLEQFGYYTMAGVVASALWAIILPINTALYPKFVQDVERGDTIGLQETYRRCCGVVAAALLPFSLLLIGYSHEIVVLWTGSEAVAGQTDTLIAILAMGTTLNGLTSIAGYLQSAAGWPQLVLHSNAAVALVLVPVLLFFVPRFGAVAAAWTWVAVNCVYVFVTTPLMHRRILPGRYSRWLGNDVVVPVLAVGLVGIASKALFPRTDSMILQLGALFLVWFAALAAALAVLPAARGAAVSFLTRAANKVFQKVSPSV